MKILLVKPYGLSDHIQPPLGLGYLAGGIMDRHEVVILDCQKQGMNLDKFRLYVEKHTPDVVGFQTYTQDLYFVRRAINIVKKVTPDTITVVGGPHPSSMPDTIFDSFENLDVGFRGEAEIGFAKFLDGEDYADIPGLIYKTEDGVRVNIPSLVEDLDDLAMPAWDLIKPEDYPESQHGFFYKRFPIAPITMTRGCPHQCTFCAAYLISGRRIRRRSVDNVLAEIEYLYRERGIREFHVIDDNFTLDQDYAMDFLRRLKVLNLDINWATPNGVRMDTLNKDMLKLMKDTGLYLISLGIESGTDRILKLMKKGLNTARIREYVEMIHQANIDIAGFFILGFPTETEEEIIRTVQLSLDLPIIRANYFTYLPFPGTENYKKLESAGELKDVDWDHFCFMNASYVPTGITRSRLKWLQRTAFLKFYSRPRIFIKTISGINSPRHLYYLTKRFYHWLIMR